MNIPRGMKFMKQKEPSAHRQGALKTRASHEANQDVADKVKFVITRALFRVQVRTTCDEAHKDLMVLVESTSNSTKASFFTLFVPLFRPNAGAHRIGVLTHGLA